MNSGNDSTNLLGNPSSVYFFLKIYFIYVCAYAHGYPGGRLAVGAAGSTELSHVCAEN